MMSEHEGMKSAREPSKKPSKIFRRRKCHHMTTRVIQRGRRGLRH